MTTAQEFDYSSIDGALTPEQAAQVLAWGDGDTGAEPESSTTPEAAPVQEEEVPNADDGATQEGGADSVVLAKDGKHTIPYETLVKHREGEQHWKAQAEAAQQQLADLQAQAQARADAGIAPTKQDGLLERAEAAIEAGADIELFGDFSAEAMVAGFKTLLAQERAEMRDAIKAELKAERQAEESSKAHYDAIYGKHPDADSIAQSKEFSAWVNAQPSAIRSAYWGLFDPNTGGTASEIVEVFDAFKASGTPNPKSTSAALAQTKVEPPSSLSSIPGARAASPSPLDADADMSGVEMLHATEGMSPAQIEAWLDRQI